MDAVTQHPCPKCGTYTTNAEFCDKCQPSLPMSPLAPPSLGEILQKVTATSTSPALPGPVNDPGVTDTIDPIEYMINHAQQSLAMQIGGNHYQRADATIQPIEFLHDNAVPYPEASAMLYVYRWRDKGGIADLKKAAQTIWQIVAMEERKAARLAALR